MRPGTRGTTIAARKVPVGRSEKRGSGAGAHVTGDRGGAFVAINGADAQRRLHEGSGNSCTAKRRSRKGIRPHGVVQMGDLSFETTLVVSPRYWGGQGQGLALVGISDNSLVRGAATLAGPRIAAAPYDAVASHAPLGQMLAARIRRLSGICQTDREVGMRTLEPGTYPSVGRSDSGNLVAVGRQPRKARGN